MQTSMGQVNAREDIFYNTLLLKYERVLLGESYE